jgi:hypothetical protein
VSSLERYLLGSYGLRYHRDRSRVNVSSMKLKADGTKRARMAAHGFKQVPGVHYSL